VLGVLKVDVWMLALFATTKLLVRVATVIGADAGDLVGDFGVGDVGDLTGARVGDPLQPPPVMTDIGVPE